jgi:hypothetical protein
MLKFLSIKLDLETDDESGAALLGTGGLLPDSRSRSGSAR